MAKTTSKKTSAKSTKTTAKATKTTSKAKAAPAGKAKSAKAKAAPKGDGPKRLDRKKVVPQILKMRDQKNMSWGDIGAELEINPGTVRHLYMSETTPADLLWENEEELFAHIVEQRENNVSWPNIGIRTGTSQPKVKAVFEKHSGKSANQGWVVSQARAAERKAAADANKKTKAKKVKTSRAKKAKSGN